MASGGKGVVVVPMAGLRKILPPPSKWRQYQLEIEVGTNLDLEKALLTLVQMGYSRSGMITTPGEFSVRGGILDVYPLTEADPLRIELFDTEVDSIRTFSIDDQRSKEMKNKVMIGPATESPIDASEFSQIADQVEAGLSRSLKRIKDEKTKEQMLENIGFEIEQLRNGQKPEQFYKFLSYAYQPAASLLDYLSSNGLLIFDELSRIQEMNDRLEKEEGEWFTSLLERGEIIHGNEVSHQLSKLLVEHDTPRIYLSLFLRHIPSTNPQNISNISCKLMQNFHGQMHLLKTEVDRWQKGGYSVVFLAPNFKELKQMQSILYDYEIEAAITEKSGSIVSWNPDHTRFTQYRL